VNKSKGYAGLTEDKSRNSAAFNKCNKILRILKELKYSPPFLQPVDPIKLNLPDYLEKIKYPMDLGTIQTKLNSLRYKTTN